MATTEEPKKETAPEDKKEETPTEEAAAIVPIKATTTKWMPSGDNIAGGGCLLLAVVYAIMMVQTECRSAEGVLWSILVIPMALVIFFASLPVAVLIFSVDFILRVFFDAPANFTVPIYYLLGFPWFVAGFRLDQFDCVYRETMRWWS